MKQLKKLAKKVYLLLKKPYCFFCVKKILKLYNKNQYDELSNLEFEYLNILKERDINKFKEVKNKIESYNIDRLKNNSNIEVGFVLYTQSMWSCDSLYKMLEKDKRFIPYILICKDANDMKKNDEKYNSARDYFMNNKYNVIDYENSQFDINDMDFVFYLTPFKVVPNSYNIRKMKMKVLTAYITYSFMVADREKKFLLPVYQLTWRFFADTSFYKKMMKEKCPTSDDNVVFCGYTRMDEFYNSNINHENEIWKLPKDCDKKVYKIIYAPHHSVFDENAGYSTFDQNYKYILEIAKKYSKNTSWIIKPHPLLRSRIIKNGFFKDEEEYDNYLKEWEKLPNARVVTDGTYFDIFKSSDTMILDSVSFLAEYQYVHKPLLFLTRETQKFNEFGDHLKKILYCVPGDDYDGIDNYINEVLFKNNDYMKKERNNFFNKYLDYYTYNNKQLASEYVYSCLKDISNKKEVKKNEKK